MSAAVPVNRYAALESQDMRVIGEAHSDHVEHEQCFECDGDFANEPAIELHDTARASGKPLSLYVHQPCLDVMNARAVDDLIGYGETCAALRKVYELWRKAEIGPARAMALVGRALDGENVHEAKIVPARPGVAA